MHSKTILIGNIGKDAEVKSINNRDLISFSLAESDNYTAKNGEKVNRTVWHNCQKWVKGGSGNNLAQHLKKGNMLYLEGKSRASAYLNKSGEATASLDFIISELKFINNGNKKTEQGYQAEAKQEQGSDLPF